MKKTKTKNEPIFTRFQTDTDFVADPNMDHAAATAKRLQFTATMKYPNHARMAAHEHDVWNRLGRPSFKIYPALVDGLIGINLDIDADALHAPFRCFTVLLPRGHWLVDRIGDAIFVAIATRDELPQSLAAAFRGDASRNYSKFISIHCRLSESEGFLHQFLFPCNSGATINAAIKEMDVPPPEDYKMTREDTKIAITIGLAVAFFGVGNHELVAPDIKRPVVDRNCRPKVLGMREEHATKKYDAQVTKCRSWLVGSEIDLPRPETAGRGDGQHDTRGALTSGHLRSGHMRMQPHGPGLKDRKLIFVPSVMVRPDLPFKASPGYRIRGENTASAETKVAGGVK